mmetsp:Transcript_59670/g.194681  ORF Transcript_59670/g.194681 Transcript_59670/m.194681 type:complete len:382 (-) Transcript_59670:520-1665(-)
MGALLCAGGAGLRGASRGLPGHRRCRRASLYRRVVESSIGLCIAAPESRGGGRQPAGSFRPAFACWAGGLFGEGAGDGGHGELGERCRALGLAGEPCHIIQCDGCRCHGGCHADTVHRRSFQVLGLGVGLDLWRRRRSGGGSRSGRGRALEACRLAGTPPARGAEGEDPGIGGRGDDCAARCQRCRRSPAAPRGGAGGHRQALGCPPRRRAAPPPRVAARARPHPGLCVRRADSGAGRGRLPALAAVAAADRPPLEVDRPLWRGCAGNVALGVLVLIARSAPGARAPHAPARCALRGAPPDRPRGRGLGRGPLGDRRGLASDLRLLAGRRRRQRRRSGCTKRFWSRWSCCSASAREVGQRISWPPPSRSEGWPPCPWIQRC